MKSEFFREKFAKGDWERPRLDDISFSILSHEVTASLSQPFSLDEVGKVVADVMAIRALVQTASTLLSSRPSGICFAPKRVSSFRNFTAILSSLDRLLPTLWP